jgi:hypothetical protein
VEVGQVRLEKNGASIQTICTNAILLSGSGTDSNAIMRARRVRGLFQAAKTSD